MLFMFWINNICFLFTFLHTCHLCHFPHFTATRDFFCVNVFSKGCMPLLAPSNFKAYDICGG